MIGGDTRTAIEGGAQVAGPEPGPTVGETRPKRLGEGGGGGVILPNPQAIASLGVVD
jgi:hypothetical protein